MPLEKLPEVIRNNRFNVKGLAIIPEKGLFVPAYVASNLGFDQGGREQLKIFYENLILAGVLPFCPFQACKEYLGPFPEKKDIYEAHFNYWDSFNKIIIPKVNRKILMPRSKLLIAICEGRDVDPGVAAETSHYATKAYGPVIGIRTDFRQGENIASPINPAVLDFFSDEFQGKFFNGDGAYGLALHYIIGVAARMVAESD